MPDIAFRFGLGASRCHPHREVSSRELLDHYLKRIEQYNPQINANCYTRR